MGGFQEGGFQIVERAAFSSRGTLLLQGNSYLKSTLRLLLRRRVGGQICYLKNPLPKTPHSIFPIQWGWKSSAEKGLESVDERQITHLICARLKYMIYMTFLGEFWACFLKGPQTPPKKVI